jgi:hypothetical protein
LAAPGRKVISRKVFINNNKNNQENDIKKKKNERK